MTRIGLPRFASFLTRTTKEETDALGEDPRREPRRARVASRSDPEGEARAEAGAVGDAGADPEAGPLKRVRRGQARTSRLVQAGPTVAASRWLGDAYLHRRSAAAGRLPSVR